ncbi:alpha/beta hydrolase [Paraburkholderia terricola]|uniref:alpha/beta hydrolase n=1 Tax=Paraburkholderia terricola TaxID=169427 RepID=UPI000DEF267D|nr:alpha/beta hydrolase [Paraburkholderia terricola]AXE93982.1 alpha/beta hydrolase [Paraburkholderia terricola]
MEQKFTGDIGQVAGRDVKSNSAQSSVNVHIHNGPKTKYISDRQRRAIAHKVYQIEAKTGTDKLMVYRRLMAVFKFSSMDEMPHDLYERATSYLNTWLRNGTTDQPSVKAKTQRPAQSTETRTHDVTENVTAAAAPDRSSLSHQPESLGPMLTGTMAPEKPTPPWRAVVVACGAVAAVAAVTYIVVVRSAASARPSAAPVVAECEYGGHHYSIGSVVLQAGLRQQCVTTDENAATWEKLGAGRRVAGK